MTEIECPKCGVSIQTTPPNTTHLVFTTIEPDESNTENFIERTLKCSDPNSSPYVRMPHKFIVFWRQKRFVE